MNAPLPVSIALMCLGMLCVFAGVFSVLGHGITARSPRFEPFILLAAGATLAGVGIYLLNP